MCFYHTLRTNSAIVPSGRQEDQMKHSARILISVLTGLSVFFALPSSASASAMDSFVLNEQQSIDAKTDTKDLVRIRNKVFRITDNASEWNGSSGWRNDPDNGYIVFVNYDGSGTSLTTGDVEVTLAMSGLNRLKKISAGQTVNIIGTGILLLDGIEMAAGAELNVQPDTNIHTTGSVAVFLKQTDNTYLMINGPDVPGILDESYTLPADTHLTVPSRSTLDLTVIIVKTEEYADENGTPVRDTTYYVNDVDDTITKASKGGTVSLTETTGQLTIPASSSLSISENGTLNVHTIEFRLAYEAKLLVEGSLVLDGTVDDGTIDIRNGGVLAGSGTMKNGTVFLNAVPETSGQIKYENSVVYLTGITQGKKLNPILSDSILMVHAVPADLGNVTASGDSVIGYRTGTDADRIDIVEGGNLLLGSMSPMGEDIVMTLKGSLSGGVLTLGGGRFIVDPNIEISSDIQYRSVVVFDGTEKQTVSDWPAVLNAAEAAAALEDSADTVRLLYANVEQHKRREGYFIMTVTDGPAEYGISRGEDDSAAAGDVLTAAGVSEDEREFSWVEAFRYDEENGLSYAIYMYGDTIDLTGTFLLRAYTVHKVEDSSGGSTSTSTNTEFTGTGKLGNNTGTLTGGTATMIWQGTGSSEPDFGNKDKDKEKKPEQKDDETSSGDDNSGQVIPYEEETAAAPVTQPVRPQTAPAVQQPDDRLSPSVTAGRNGQYTLSVYRNGRQLDDLNGRKVTAEVRFPEGVTEDTVCYAVFEQNGKDLWIPAVYDKDRNILSFEANMPGTFRIAKANVEDVIFSGLDTPVYRELTVQAGNDELKELPVPVSVKVPHRDEPAGKYHYAVFADEDENIHVYPAVFDADSSRYLFDSGMPGSFVIVGLDKEYEEGSEALYEACRNDSAVRVLMTLLKVYAFWR